MIVKYLAYAVTFTKTREQSKNVEFRTDTLYKKYVVSNTIYEILISAYFNIVVALRYAFFFLLFLFLTGSQATVEEFS